MNLRAIVVWLLLAGLVLYGCLPAGNHGQATSKTTAPASPAVTVADFPGAGAVDLTVAPDGTLYVALSMDSAVAVARSTDEGGAFTQPVPVSQETHAFVNPIERPALATTPAGRLIVAWTDGMTIWRAISDDHGATFSESVEVSGESFGGEAGLVRMALDEADNPVLTWLYAGMLQLARSRDSGATFQPGTILDSTTCECCYPPPLIVKEQVFVAYRNQEFDQGKNVRDIFVITSQDGGATFQPEVRVNDAPWVLSACPLSGPALAYHADKLYVSWMDGRNDAQRDLSQTDIWLATSSDGGKTFSQNQRVNPTTGVYNNRPALAVDTAGRLHIVWEAQEPARDVIYYAHSDDGGVTFSDPWAVVSLVDYQGQVVLVNFWATWCGPCREEMPALDAFYQRHQRQGFVVLAVNAGEPPERVRTYLAQTKYTFPVFLDRDGALAAGFGSLRGMPTSFILNREGEIVKQHVGVLTPGLLAEYVTPLLVQDE